MEASSERRFGLVQVAAREPLIVQDTLFGSSQRPLRLSRQNCPFAASSAGIPTQLSPDLTRLRTSFSSSRPFQMSSLNSPAFQVCRPGSSTSGTRISGQFRYFDVLIVKPTFYLPLQFAGFEKAIE